MIRLAMLGPKVGEDMRLIMIRQLIIIIIIIIILISSPAFGPRIAITLLY